MTEGQQSESYQGPSLPAEETKASLRQTIHQRDQFISQLQGQILWLRAFIRQSNPPQMEYLQSLLPLGGRNQNTTAEAQAEIQRLRETVKTLTDNKDRLEPELIAKSRIANDLEAKYAHSSQQVRELQQQLTDVSSHVNILEKDFTDIQHALTEKDKIHEGEIREHEELTALLQNEIKIMKEDLVSMEVAEARTRDLVNSNKISDDLIRGKWNTMAYNIKALASTLLTHCPPMKQLQPQENGRLCTISRMTPEDYNFLQDEDMRSLIVQKYLWQSVVSSVLGGCRKSDMRRAWGKDVGKNFCIFLMSFQDAGIPAEDKKEFYRWKAQGSDMIEKIVGSDMDDLASIVMAEHEGFSLLLSEEKQGSQTAKQRLAKQLHKVYADAAELHSIFMKSKALFQVGWMENKGTLKYKPKYMEAMGYENDLDNKSVVICQVSPVLLKYGNADGMDYDKGEVLIKLNVVCD